MGCCETRELTQEEHLEQMILKTQNLIGFNNIRLCDISKVLDTMLSLGSISQNFFDQICKKLKINSSDPIIRNFYLTWYQTSPNTYNRKKLVTLTTLMCIGTREEKALIIFNNYKKEDKEFITKDDVKTMIEDICMIFIKEIFSFAKSLNLNYLLISKFEMEFIGNFVFIVSYFLENIFEDCSDKGMHFDSFLRKMSFSTVSSLLVPNELRRKCLLLIKFIQKAQCYARGMISNMEEKESQSFSAR